MHGDIETDVCIIGGGFSGVASALSLAERGFDVVLLEGRRIGWGASGRSGGQILPGWSGESAIRNQLGERASAFLERTRYFGNEIIETRIKKYAIDCDYERGAATLALNEKQMAALEAEYASHAKTGADFHFDLVDRATISNHVASEIYCGGLIDRRGAHCHPLNLCLGEARAAESLGVRIFEESLAVDIAHSDRPGVITKDGRVNCRIAILAGNAYHKLEQGKLGGYMLPAQTFQIATEVIGENRARAILPDNLAVCDANWALDYFRRSADHRILFGGLCTYSNRTVANIENELTPRLLRIFPQLGDVKTEFAWGGAIGIVLNRAPLIGRIADNVFYAQGYSGHGVNCSHIAGEIFADAAQARLDDINLFETIRHLRIPAASAIGNPMLALGMTWFRMRDAIDI
ncbi:MAG: FAD-binding oxidoreductase [Parvularculaceae bacterium]|nr:FAD-binding oxidoreductase [Parvularculaceae bacterium]